MTTYGAGMRLNLVHGGVVSSRERQSKYWLRVFIVPCKGTNNQSVLLLLNELVSPSRWDVQVPPFTHEAAVFTCIVLKTVRSL